MSVTVALKGRLGNNLFQYAIARQIAERHGLALDTLPVPLEDGQPGRNLALTGASTLDQLATQFPNVLLSLEGDTVTEPVEAYELRRGDTWKGQTFPFKRVLADASRRQIRLHGYFQRFEYLADSIAAIQSWFESGLAELPYSCGPNDVLVNIRRDLDFGVCGWVLPVGYYTDILSRLPRIDQVFVCGTGGDDDIREALEPFHPVYVDGTPFQHFSFIQRFRRIVLSNSTFAWWAAFLSGATEIYGPRAMANAGYAFTGFEDVDLHMRQTRYHEVPVLEFGAGQLTLKSRMRGACLIDRGSHLLVERDGCEPVRVVLRESTRTVIMMLVTHDQISIDDYRRSGQSVPPAVIGQLLRSGLVAIRAQRHSPDAVQANQRSRETPILRDQREIGRNHIDTAP